jgi:hypothetical protein
MDKTPPRWRVFDPETPVLTCAYSFGPGTANALAVGTPAGLFVLSPPARAADAVFDELGVYGTVAALVAPNAFHHMGLVEWKKRFPQAPVFAPVQAVARVSRKTHIAEVQPVGAARELAGPRVELVDMPHYRTGEILARVESRRGLAWYVTDVVSNLPSLPSNPLIGFIYSASGSAPGLKFNNFASLFMVRDKRALKRWLAAECRQDPPRWLIPAHGEIAELGSSGSTLKALFEG